jgi:hypothetical protein
MLTVDQVLALFTRIATSARQASPIEVAQRPAVDLRVSFHCGPVMGNPGK